MARLGQITFQANDRSDIFLVTDVSEGNAETSDEMLIGVSDAQFDSDKPWITGNVPKMTPVNVEGDSVSINAWFRGEVFPYPFTVRIYLECEMAEELLEVQSEELEEADDKSDLEPQEVNL